MHEKQTGFGLVEVLIVLFVFTMLGLAGWKVFGGKNADKTGSAQQNSSTSQNTASSTQEADIQLQNIGLQDIQNIDVSPQAVREFESKGLKGFYVFGDTLSGNRQNPNFEYSSLKTGTKVVAAIEGVVGFVKEQPETNDAEVFLQPREGSKWTVGYDHLVNVSVKRGDRIKAGDILGEPAPQNNGLLRFEIQVNKDENGVTTHICPTTLFALSVKDELIAQLSTMQNEWESVTGLELYDLNAQNPIGCLMQTLSPAQAEGR